jgi:hypothetical protein
MDNRRLDVMMTGRAHFDAAMKMAFDSHRKAVAYCDHPALGLVLLWHDSPKAIAENPLWVAGDTPEARAKTRAEITARATPVAKLPYPMTVEAACDFAWHWLTNTTRGSRPDIDGSTGEAWRVYFEQWGHVGDCHYSIVAVQAVWACYGK